LVVIIWVGSANQSGWETLLVGEGLGEKFSPLFKYGKGLFDVCSDPEKMNLRERRVKKF
jgi:hypothetical protein